MTEAIPTKKQIGSLPWCISSTRSDQWMTVSEVYIDDIGRIMRHRS
jgi:hypothetical protein